MLRGRVLTTSGQGLRGVRVSNGLALREGFTLTRPDGYFDILVTAGRVIKLKFGKSPFPYQSRNIFVPKNQVREAFKKFDICHSKMLLFCNSKSFFLSRPKVIFFIFELSRNCFWAGIGIKEGVSQYFPKYIFVKLLNNKLILFRLL